MTTGKYLVVMKSGRKFMVEEWSNHHVPWTDMDSATQKLHKVVVKDAALINESSSEIRKENGFKSAHSLSLGTSALSILDVLDKSGVERVESE